MVIDSSACELGKAPTPNAKTAHPNALSAWRERNRTRNRTQINAQIQRQRQKKIQRKKEEKNTPSPPSVVRSPRPDPAITSLKADWKPKQETIDWATTELGSIEAVRRQYGEIPQSLPPPAAASGTAKAGLGHDVAQMDHERGLTDMAAEREIEVKAANARKEAGGARCLPLAPSSWVNASGKPSLMELGKPALPARLDAHRRP